MTLMKLSEVCTIRYGKDHKKLADGFIPVYGSGGVMRYVEKSLSAGPSVLIPRKGTLGNLFYSSGPFWTVDTLFWTEIDQGIVEPKYLYYALKTKDLASLNIGTAVPSLSTDVLNEVELEIPEKKTQKSIAALLGSIESKIESSVKLNDYLAELCEAIASKYCETGDACLNDICRRVAERCDCGDADLSTYVSTESLLQNKQGRQLASSLPATGKVTCYKAGDTLVSNIRPYFKKVWYAPFDGTCSGDVLVFRANKASMAPYLHACLRQDRFFDHVMRGAKGTKMPRGDKKQMMEFVVSPECEPEDLALLNAATQQIAANASENESLAELRDTLLPKLMSGEIDVSKVNLTQLNNHLVEC